MTVVLRKLSVNGWKTFEKKNQPMFYSKKNARKKNKRKKIERKNIEKKILDLLKVKGMTACLKKVDCEWMENFRKKNQSMFGYKENARKKNKREKV